MTLDRLVKKTLNRLLNKREIDRFHTAYSFCGVKFTRFHADRALAELKAGLEGNSLATRQELLEANQALRNEVNLLKNKNDDPFTHYSSIVYELGGGRIF